MGGSFRAWDWLAIQGGSRKSQRVTQCCPAVKAKKRGYSQPKGTIRPNIRSGWAPPALLCGVDLCRGWDKGAPEESVPRGVCHTAGQ